MVNITCLMYNMIGSLVLNRIILILYDHCKNCEWPSIVVQWSIDRGYYNMLYNVLLMITVRRHSKYLCLITTIGTLKCTVNMFIMHYRNQCHSELLKLFFFMNIYEFLLLWLNIAIATLECIIRSFTSFISCVIMHCRHGLHIQRVTGYCKNLQFNINNLV